MGLTCPMFRKVSSKACFAPSQKGRLRRGGSGGGRGEGKRCQEVNGAVAERREERRGGRRLARAAGGHGVSGVEQGKRGKAG